MLILAPGSFFTNFFTSTPQTALQKSSTNIRRHIKKFRQAAELAHREDTRHRHVEVINQIGDNFARLPTNFADEPKMAKVSFPVSTVNMNRNLTFTGRDNDLNRAHEVLMKPNKGESAGRPEADASTKTKTGPASCVLHDVGGISKTQVALEYTYRYLEEYNAVFWLAEEHDWTLTSTYARISDILGLLDSKTLEDQADKRQNLAIEKAREWLATTGNISVCTM